MAPADDAAATPDATDATRQLDAPAADDAAVPPDADAAMQEADDAAAEDTALIAATAEAAAKKAEGNAAFGAANTKKQKAPTRRASLHWMATTRPARSRLPHKSRRATW